MRGSLAGVACCLCLVAATGAGCRRSTPDRPAARGIASELEVLKEGRFLFTYVEPNGSFATTDKPEIIPEPVRKIVRVIDPGQTKAPDVADVYVANVKDLLHSGKVAARPLSREVFETAAIAQLAPGASSMREPGKTHPRSVDDAADGGNRGTPSAPGAPVVTIYGTSWCGACRAARQYLSEKKIPFADKDIEVDPAAAQELAAKAEKAGIPTDRVPVLDVRGRLLLGFDPARVEALLGNPT
jgi:glutaredoxin